MPRLFVITPPVFEVDRPRAFCSQALGFEGVSPVSFVARSTEFVGETGRWK